MTNRLLATVCLGLACAAWGTGCQSSGRQGEGDGLASFGVDSIPRQSEPHPEGEIIQASASEPPDNDPEEKPAKRPFLSRLIPGKNKEEAERKSLPINERTEGASDDDFEL
ncbi:MAG: hypothetical protein ACKV0T_14275 [Planctomycetales bacterium]